MTCKSACYAVHIILLPNLADNLKVMIYFLEIMCKKVWRWLCNKCAQYFAGWLHM